MLFGMQSLFAVAVTLGIAVAWTLAITVVGVYWRRLEIREFLASRPVTTPSREATQADDVQDLVLR